MTTYDPIVIADVALTESDYRALSDDDIAAVNAFRNAMEGEAYPEDPPVPLRVTEAEARNLPDFVGLREFWARDPDGSIAADGWGWWRKTEENRHVAWMRVEVRPDRRRRGLAKALLERILGSLQDGRTTAIGWTSDRVPAGEAFARRLGADAASAIHTNRLLLADLDHDLIRKWVKHGPERAPGYSLVTVDGRYPDDIVEQVANVYAVMNTAPRDDLELEDETHTVEQIRAWETSRDAAGTIRWSIFARHDASNELIGLTEIYWNPAEPHTMYQGDTGVDPGHRGHALGKWLKAQMLERILAERPEIEEIRTGNADSNDAMLGINHALGFQPYIASMNWQVPVEKLRAYVAGSST
jgi:GNAT superfamily N-acetyltransferase